ncbi:MAG: DNA topoisomerase IB, partial [Patescibacteria group bacterium]|nr:DNA topoisomerase IB [Patescibacteria group bacterium]
IQKTRADVHEIYSSSGVVSADEVRLAVAADPESPYAGLDLDAEAAPGIPEGQAPEDPADPLTEHIDRAAEAEGGVVSGDAAWEKEEHPRDENGEFIQRSDAKSSSKKPDISTKIEDGKRVQANGNPLPEYISKLKIPPAWSDVRYNANANGDLLVVGRDGKGRVQAIYSEGFTARQAATKFARIEALRQEYPGMVEENDRARQSEDRKLRDVADCLALVMVMGIRPGSDSDTKAKVKAYGATTLEGRHVVVDGDEVALRFVGKKGVNLDLPVTDAGIKAMLRDRAAAAAPDGKLFPEVSDKSLLAHTHSLDGGHFKTKDFRTRLATETAYELVAAQAAPETEAGYKKAVMAVAKAVSQKLGNTPTIALQSYINPVVFASWRIGS